MGFLESLNIQGCNNVKPPQPTGKATETVKGIEINESRGNCFLSQPLAFLGTSAMSWMVLRGLLGGVNTSSTGTGRIWRAVPVVFRLLVCMLAAKHVWKEGQSLSATLGSPAVQTCVLTTSSSSPRSDFGPYN